MSDFKRLISELNKSERCAFLLLEEMMIKNKIEIIELVNNHKPINYNDAELREQIKALDNKLNNVLMLMENFRFIDSQANKFQTKESALEDFRILNNDIRGMTDLLQVLMECIVRNKLINGEEGYKISKISKERIRDLKDKDKKLENVLG